MYNQRNRYLHLVVVPTSTYSTMIGMRVVELVWLKKNQLK